MIKKIFVVMVLVLVLISGVFAFTLQNFISMDLDNINRNIKNVGIIKIEYKNDKGVFNSYNYLVDFDTVVKGKNNSFEVITKSCNYNIDKNKYIACVLEKNRAECKIILGNKIENYCKRIINNDLDRIKELQKEAQQNILEQEIENDFMDLEVQI